jgi:hypothetical protein
MAKSNKIAAVAVAAEIAAVVAPVVATVAEPVAAAKPTHKTKAELFAQSLARVKSTGNPSMDVAMQRILTKIHDGAVMEQTETGFAGVIGKAPVTLSKITKGKAARCILSVGGMEIGGGFASKAFGLCMAQNRVPAASKVHAFDEAKVAELAELLGL